MNKLVEDAVFGARQIKTLMFGKYERRISIHLITDLEGALKSIVSMKQVERKSLRMVNKDLKERLIDREIASYLWIPTDSMWVDALTKETEMHEHMEELLI